MGVFLRPDLNLIQKKDIHTRKELWKQKVKLLDLKKFDKDFWDKSYDFLPLPKTYQRIRDKVKAWIEKNKAAEAKFLELQKKVGEELVNLAQIANGQVRTEEDELGLFEEERPQPDLGKLKELRKGAIALKRNDWEQLEKLNNEAIQSEEIRGLVEEWKEIKEELREPCSILWHENNAISFVWHNSGGADLGLGNYGFLYRNKLYFVSSFVYIDNAKLICRVVAYVDLIYLYYGNYLRGSGVIKLNRAPLFQEDLEDPLSKSNKLHYSFCDDKGNLTMEEIKNPSIQPRLKTVILDLKKDVSTSRIEEFKAGPGNAPIIPTQLSINDISTLGGIVKWSRGFIDSLTGDQTLAFLAPAGITEGDGKGYFDNKSIQYVSFSKVQGGDGTPENPGTGVQEEITLPEKLIECPHLIHESTVQIFFLNKLIHQGFLNQFDLEEKQGTNPDGNNAGKYVVLKFLNQIRANPSGIYYLMHSATQFWKAELSVSQVFKTQTLMQKVREGAMAFFAKRGDLLDFVGLNNDVPDEKPKNEQNAKRTYTNTNKSSKDRPRITPDLLYPNTVDLKYDFFEFANRYSSPYLVFRFQYSNDLRNNLMNCNNKSHEFDLDLTFAQLGVLINKPGEYQGDLKLKGDSNGLMSEIFAKGVFFYEDLEKDLVNPKLELTDVQNQAVIPISDASIHVGEDTIESQTFTHQIAYQAERREYAHATWFCFSDGQVQESFKRACSCSFTHYHNNAPNTTQTGWCWGCTYDDLARSNFLATSFTPSVDCQFVYCLEVGSTPTTRQLQGGTTYNFTFTSTDILISWTVYSRTTEEVAMPTVNQDDFQQQQQPDQAEEIPDLSDLEENEGEEELSEGEEQQEEEEETESESEDEEVESSEEESSSEENEESSEESESSEEEEENEDDEEDDDEQSEEE